MWRTDYGVSKSKLDIYSTISTSKGKGMSQKKVQKDYKSQKTRMSVVRWSFLYKAACMQSQQYDRSNKA